MRAWRPLGGAVLLTLALLPAAASPASASAGGPRAFQPAARPTDKPDPARHSYTVPEAPRSPACAAGFCVHWVAEGVDAPSLSDTNGDGVPDYVERVLRVAAHVRSIENGKLGWRAPLSDGSLGGGHGETDIYLEDLGRMLFGYSAPDRERQEKGGRLPRRLYGYLVLDNDYDPFEYPGTSQLRILEVTIAHEYNHILQMGYDAYQDAWFAESSATWMEHQVYPGIEDYLRYVRRWVNLYSTPLTANSIREYGSAVWNEWLARRYGPSVVREAWARAIHTRPAGFAVAAYDSAIRADGGPGFAADLVRFARDTAEWRTGSAFPQGPRYPDVPRQASLPRDGQPIERPLNHATFELLAVHARGARAVTVHALAPNGIDAGLALVGRLGGQRHGRVVSRLSFKPGGGPLQVSLPRPGRFRRITAVVVNADTSEHGFDARRLDWNYLTDMVPFRVRAEAVP